jgi:hypothetical protein
MKKLLVLSLSILLALPVIALAQDPASQSSGSSQGSGSARQNDSSMGQGTHDSSMGHGAKSGNVKGTISQDGKSVVSDTDGKSWTIANPEAVKGHEGHHVELKGSTDASTGEIQVTSVKMLKGEKGSMKKDSN